MVINHNISAIYAHRNVSYTNNFLTKSIEKLSSGLRINRAGDDAAGLAISERMRGQVAGLNQGMRNTQDGLSLLQTAEAALSETHSVLQRLRVLAIQSANDTYNNTDRQMIQYEVGQLLFEINRIASTSEFNRNVLLDGRYSATGVPGDATYGVGGTGYLGSIVFQVSANGGTNNRESFSIGRMSYSALGLVFTGQSGSIASISLSTRGLAISSISFIDSAIDLVSNQRSELGGFYNRLEHTLNWIGVEAENMTAAESRIRDVDMALEMSNFTKLQILSQAGMAMLAQANLKPQTILQLLG